MFAIAQSFHQLPMQSYTTHAYNPSSLAPRDPNARPHMSNLFASKMSNTTSRASSTSPFLDSSYSSDNSPSTNVALSAVPSISRLPPTRPRPTHIRGSKYASLNRDATTTQEQRRQQYLSRVQDQREEKRHEARGEQNLRREWLDANRAWDEEKCRQREAQTADVDADLDDYENWEQGMDEGQNGDWEMLRQEEEYEAMLQDQDGGDDVDLPLPWEGMRTQGVGQEREMTDYGSDDDEYERIMLDMAIQAESAEECWASSAVQRGDGMDMS